MDNPSANPPSWMERFIHLIQREPNTKSDLVELLCDAKQRELINEDALLMIEGVLNVSDMKVRDIMLPRAQMVALSSEAPIEETLAIVIESNHSRFPVMDNRHDAVIGILLAKDLLKYTAHPDKPCTVTSIIRPATFIPESKRLDVLLKEFRLKRNHMAIVVDEYGNASGLITIEDVLEQIVGDIIDETDIEDQEPNILQVNDLEYSVKALTPINEFNEYFNTDFEDTDFDTIAGVLLHKLSHLPKAGETIHVDDLKITIASAQARRIRRLTIKRILPPEQQ